jgi:hypothetical protein
MCLRSQARRGLLSDAQHLLRTLNPPSSKPRTCCRIAPRHRRQKKVDVEERAWICRVWGSRRRTAAA